MNKLMNFFRRLSRFRIKLVEYTDTGKRGKVKVGKETYLYNPMFNPHLEQHRN